MKTFDYIIVLKKRNHSTVDGVSQIMLLIAIIAFIGNGINGLYNALSSYAFAVLVIGWGAFCIWQKKKGNAPFYRFGLCYPHYFKTAALLGCRLINFSKSYRNY